MEKGLLYFTISVALLWVILDEFFGSKKLSGIADNLTPDIKSPTEAVKEAVTDTVDKAKEKVKDAVQGTKTPKEKKDDAKKAKDNVDKSNVNDKAKGAIKDAIDKFYETVPGYTIDA